MPRKCKCGLVFDSVMDARSKNKEKVQKLGIWPCYNPLGLAASLDVSNVRTQYTIILCFVALDDRFF
ncbi:unnamed protein product [Sphagnum jensenii]|uniref:Uncharacterized protein n=1 Tax=Sphagnum jensenii TaxID=128206 RepID=A0ABP0W014_9BRYO